MSSELLDEPVLLCEHNAQWAIDTETEIQRIVHKLDLRRGSAEHIGSTAVPGLVAKPTIDIMVGLAEWPPSAGQIQGMTALGYTSFGEAGVAGRWYFRIRDTVSVNVHVVLFDGLHWRSNLALRDYLRQNVEARERYAQVKLKTVQLGLTSLLVYSAAKASVVSELLEQATGRSSGL